VERAPQDGRGQQKKYQSFSTPNEYTHLLAGEMPQLNQQERMSIHVAKDEIRVIKCHTCTGNSNHPLHSFSFDCVGKKMCAFFPQKIENGDH
jgi:hypothetical protein